MNPIIDPSTLSEEQREAIKLDYEANKLNLEDAELGYKWLITGEMRNMEWLFGKEFFTNQKGE